MTVYLVGAGPGDPGLVTVRGAELLARADCVVYDRLVNPALLDLAPAHARRVDVGKAPGHVAMPQEHINETLVAAGRTHAVVVRLKGGDPFVFGRGGEEAAALLAAGVPFEVVPGVTSAIAAPAYAGIPVTHRDVSTHVTIVTGHEDPAKEHADVDWDALARAGGTLVILMGARNLPDLAARLLAAGRDPQTPLTAVRNGTRPDQHTIRTTLGEAANADVRAPSAIVVGDVAALDVGWFERRPLFGRRIVVTRAREQVSTLRARLTELGAEVLELPAITIEPVAFDLPPLAAYEWIVFTSPNGVDAWFDRGLTPAGLDARALAAAHLAVIGPGTEVALRARGLHADLVPERFVAEALLDAFPESTGSGQVLVARAEQARDVLPEGLVDRGYLVDVLAVYRTVVGEPDPAALAALRDGGIDAVTFTSSSTVRNFHALVGALPDPVPAIVSIGPITSATAHEVGYPVTAEADPHTIDGVVDALLRTLGR